MNDTLEETDEMASAVPTLAHKKRNCLLFLLAWAVGMGAVYAITPAGTETPIMLVDMVALVFVLIYWTYLDAAEHNVRLWRHFGILVVVCPGPIIVMPIYFIRTRGWQGGLIACGKAVAFVMLQQGLDYGTSFLVAALTWEG